MNLSLPRMPIIVEPTTMLVVHTCVAWVCNYSGWHLVSYPHPFRQCYSPPINDATSQLRSRFAYWGFDRDQCYITSDVAPMSGLQYWKRSVIRFIPWHILSASFQLKIVFLLSWVSLSCYEARPREAIVAHFLYNTSMRAKICTSVMLINLLGGKSPATVYAHV